MEYEELKRKYDELNDFSNSQCKKLLEENEKLKWENKQILEDNDYYQKENEELKEMFEIVCKERYGYAWIQRKSDIIEKLKRRIENDR